MATVGSQWASIKKTKKSSYRQLSRLNGDFLTELKRVDRPEYTNRVFFYNNATKAKLSHDVNVWFRDHEHTVRAIKRRQRCLCQALVRVQLDRHRGKRAHYQRQQQEMRDNVHRLEMELLQRRVIQRFRRNAFDKMTTRGLGNESFAGQSLEAQRLQHEKQLRLAEGKAGLDGSRAQRVVEDKQRAPASLYETACEVMRLTARKRDATSVSVDNLLLGDHSQGCLERPSISIIKTSPHFVHTKPVGRSMQSKRANQHLSLMSLASSFTKSPIKTHSNKTPKRRASKENNLDMIPEVSTPPAPSILHYKNASEGEILVDSQLDTHKASLLPEDEDVHIRQEATKRVLDVVEVHKTRPGLSSRHSIVTLTRKVPVKHQLPPIKPMIGNSLRLDGVKHDTQEEPTHGQSIDVNALSLDRGLLRHFRHKERLSSISQPVLLPQIPEMEQPDPEDVALQKQTQTLSSENRLSAKMQDSKTDMRGKQQMPLKAERNQVEDRRVKATTSLAAQIRLERRAAGKMRAELLDRLPLTEYYRSCNGTLQPLPTKPVRRLWTLPTGRQQYQRRKLLREEHAKELDLRSDINTFFTHINTRNVGQRQITANHRKTSRAISSPESNHLQKLITKMRKQSLVTAEAAAEAEAANTPEAELSKCRYLRVYHRGSITRDHWDNSELGKVDLVKLSSWAYA